MAPGWRLLGGLAFSTCILSLVTAAPAVAPVPPPRLAAPSGAPPASPQSQSILPPVFLLPGSGSSTLDAAFTTPALQRSCGNTSTVWIQDISNLLTNASCIQQALPLSFNTTSNLWVNNTNALISPHDFGGLTGVIGIPVDNPSIHPIWLAMVQMLQGQGYSVGRNLFGAPYDWRVSFYTLSRNGWFAQLQRSIETAVKANNNTRAVIAGHSLGTLVSTYFLGTYTTPAWREDNIAAYVSFSGLYAGAAVAFAQFIEGSSFGFNVTSATLWSAARTWGSLTQRAPIPEIWGDRVLISSRSKNYTASDMRQLLYDLNLPQQVANYDRIRNSIFNLTANPFYVDVYCIMGNSVPTQVGLHYDVPSFNGSVPLTGAQPMIGLGDGVVNQISLDECLSLEPVQVLNYTGMDHGSVLGNPGILNTFMGILQNYSTPIQSSVVRG